jgi:hypothetical protein
MPSIRHVGLAIMHRTRFSIFIQPPDKLGFVPYLAMEAYLSQFPSSAVHLD